MAGRPVVRSSKLGGTRSLTNDRPLWAYRKPGGAGVRVFDGSPCRLPPQPPGLILTVDDDPSVLARRRPRPAPPVRRARTASSGPPPGAEALDALRELKLRGDRVAVLLADYRMPEMSGIEFLEQAMDLFPRARRALLTAYADTDAAIAAINVVDVDHYLLKPWDPPEEKLYPVVDAMIDA